MVIVFVMLSSAPTWAGPKPSTKTAESPVQVRATKTLSAGHVTYGYRVINHSDAPITELTIGWSNCDLNASEYHGHDMELRIFQDATPDQFPSTSPPGWKFEVLTTEEDSLGCVAWEIIGPHDEIMAGQELAGFTVRPPIPDAAYTSAHWTVYVDSWRVCYTGILAPDSVRTR